MKDTALLAYYIYPLPAGTKYYREDLVNADVVEQVFDYCQILLAIITKEGWEFLMDAYGYEKLYRIDKRSGWHDCETIEEYILQVQADMFT